MNKTPHIRLLYSGRTAEFCYGIGLELVCHLRRSTDRETVDDHTRTVRQHVISRRMRGEKVLIGHAENVEGLSATVLNFIFNNWWLKFTDNFAKHGLTVLLFIDWIKCSGFNSLHKSFVFTKIICKFYVAWPPQLKIALTTFTCNYCQKQWNRAAPVMLICFVEGPWPDIITCNTAGVTGRHSAWLACFRCIYSKLSPIFYKAKKSLLFGNVSRVSVQKVGFIFWRQIDFILRAIEFLYLRSPSSRTNRKIGFI